MTRDRGHGPRLWGQLVARVFVFLSPRVWSSGKPTSADDNPQSSLSAENALVNMRSLSYLTSVAACFVAVVVASPTPKPEESPAVSPRQTSSFWYANIDHTSGAVRGFAPDLDGDYVYEVYKAVKPGDGAGIQAAITSGTNGASRHGQWFASQPRVSVLTALKGKVDLLTQDRSCTFLPESTSSARLSR